MKMTTLFSLLCLAFLSPSYAQQKVRVDLFVSDTVVNYTGESVHAISVNGQIPAPELIFTEGDTAEIYVHNLMDVETSIHWHGVILPNDQDGVPYLTTAPIYPHSIHLYVFPIVQHGTYWYHAHTDLQEQSGLYGALIFRARRIVDSIPEYTVLLSDWTNEKPSEVLRKLKMANDWYAIKKHSTQNWGEALITGYFGDKLEQEWLRMLPMDVSDVYYNTFLTNGYPEQSVRNYKAGSKVKLRVINGSSSTYFWLQFAGSKLTVVASDGGDVEPVAVDRMIIGVAETYDIVVTVPPDTMSYEFRATAEDRTNWTSLWFGNGMKMRAPTLPHLKYFEGMKMMNSMMKYDGTLNKMGMVMSNQAMDMNTVMYPEITGEDEGNTPPSRDSMTNMNSVSNPYSSSGQEGITTLNYAMLRATHKTTLPDAQTQTLRFDLTGNMNRYIWSINNFVLSDTSKILIQKGENVRIILNNQSMMRHPMHLHGHYFRVLNGMGDFAPLKNVIDIMPMEVDTIEFAAPYDGDWFFHCHILYHMMSGMGRVFSYENSPVNAQIAPIRNAWNIFANEDNMWHFTASFAAQSQAVYGKAMVMDRNYIMDAMGSADYKGSFETETHFGRFLDTRQFLKLYIGTDIRRSNEIAVHDAHVGNAVIENRTLGTLGMQYLLPLFITTDLRVTHQGQFRLQLSKNDMALTSRLRFDALWNTDKEYELGLRYIVMLHWSLSATYDSHFGPGAGIYFNY